MILLVNGTRDFDKEMNTRYDGHHSYTKQKMQLLKKISRKPFVLVKQDPSESDLKRLINAAPDFVSFIYENKKPIVVDEIEWKGFAKGFLIKNPHSLKFPEKFLFQEIVDIYLFTLNRVLHVMSFG